MAVELSFSLIDKTLQFETNSPAILGNVIKDAKFLAILDPQTVISGGKIDIFSKHAEVYADLPVGTPDDPLKYSYAKFMDANGNDLILGVPWIKAGSITIVETTNIVCTIKGRGQADIVQLRKALVASGFDQFDIVITS